MKASLTMGAVICTVVPGLPLVAARAQEGALVGEYLCLSPGSCPCQVDTRLQLAANGRWQWGEHAGTYRAAGGRVDFDGAGGAATWGPATIGPGALTFNTGKVTVVCWQPSNAGAGTRGASNEGGR